MVLVMLRLSSSKLRKQAITNDMIFMAALGLANRIVGPNGVREIDPISPVIYPTPILSKLEILRFIRLFELSSAALAQ